MNERILELAEQAGFDVKRLVEPYPGGFPREDFLALESFAELIVKECIRIDKENRDAVPGVEIARYFGIEE